MQRARIVASARAEFARHGYDRTTVAGIADAARLPRATVYELVGDKAALLSAAIGSVADQLTDELVARVEAIEVDEDRVVAATRRVVRWFVELAHRDPSVTALVRLSSSVGPDVGASSVQARLRIEAALSATMVGHPAFRDRPAVASLVARMVVAAVEAAVLSSAEEGGDDDEATDVITAFVLGGYLGTADPAGGLVSDGFGRAGRRRGEPGPTP